MKKVMCVLLAAIAMIGLQAAANSATLQAGWYVNIGGVEAECYENGQLTLYDGNFTGATGQVGPFLVSDGGGYYSDIERYVTVPATVQAGPADSLTLPLATTAGLTNALIEFGWGSSYDASQMQLSLWKQPYGSGPACIWSQTQSGSQGADTAVLDPLTSSNYYFEVTVVPEPSGFWGMLVGLCAAGFCMASGTTYADTTLQARGEKLR